MILSGVSDDARVVTGVDAATLVIDHGVEGILGGCSVHELIAVLRFRQERRQIELIGEGDECADLLLVVLKTESIKRTNRNELKFNSPSQFVRIFSNENSQ